MSIVFKGCLSKATFFFLKITFSYSAYTLYVLTIYPFTLSIYQLINLSLINL